MEYNQMNLDPFRRLSPVLANVAFSSLLTLSTASPMCFIMWNRSKTIFSFPFWKRVQHRMNVSFGHIHTNSLDSIDLLRGELIEIACQALFVIALCDFLHRTAIQVADDRDIVLPSARRFFVDSVDGG